MDAIDIVLMLDIIAAVLAGILFLVGWWVGPPLSTRLSLPIKVLMVFALLFYLGTELIIGKEFNILWGALFVVLAAAAFYFLARPKNQS
ncbi:MAG: hypothetical protein Kow0031_20690 [Anaerolineae bacterium]